MGGGQVQRWELPKNAPELIEPVQAPRLRAVLAAALSPALSIVVPAGVAVGGTA